MTMLRQIAFATAVVTPWSVTQAADAGSGVSTRSQSDPSSATTPGQADATFANYRFRDGETLPRLRLHYATLGQPHRNAQGAIGGRFVVRAVSDGSVGHLSMAYPALWADHARDFVAWLSAS